MRKTKKMLSAILTIIFSVFTLLSSMTVQAAVKNTVIPKVQFASAPVTEYTVGDRIQFNINSPNFKGKVEYRVVLWDDSKKSYSDLWNEKNGYPNHYYTKWQPTGNTIFTLGWPIFEPGNYRITVYAKRVGVAPGKAALKGMNCDSYKESVAFTVKSKVALLDKEGHAYGSSDENRIETYKEDTKITAKNIALSNAKVEGDLYILEDNAVIKNVSADGKIVVDPGKDGNCILENVRAKNIEVLSGGKNSIHIKNVQAETMNISSSTPVRIEADGDTEIVSTTASGCVIFDRKNGTYGTIIIKEGSDGIPVIEFRGDIKDKVQVETAATIKTGENSKISNLVISTEKATDKVTLEGQYDRVEIAREVKLEVAANSRIESIAANRDANIKLDKTAVVVKVDKGSNNVVVVKEGTAEPSTPPSTGGGGGESSGDDNYVPSTVPVNSITITSPGNTVEVIKGKTLQLSAVVEPNNATNKEVIWSVATLAGGTALIDRSTGFLQATGIGTVRVTATNVASGVIGVKDITITAPVETPIPLISIGAIVGKVQVGAELSPGLVLPIEAVYSFQWQICDTVDGTYVDIAGATTNIYTPVTGDVGKYIKVKATGAVSQSGISYSGTVTSDPVGPVLGLAAPKAIVTFTKNPADITLTVFKGAAEVQPEADGTYKLEKGDYTYTASKAGYKTQSNVAFTVTDIDITNGKGIDVVLVKESVSQPAFNHVTYEIGGRQFTLHFSIDNLNESITEYDLQGLAYHGGDEFSYTLGTYTKDTGTMAKGTYRIGLNTIDLVLTDNDVAGIEGLHSFGETEGGADKVSTTLVTPGVGVTIREKSPAIVSNAEAAEGNNVYVVSKAGSGLNKTKLNFIYGADLNDKLEYKLFANGEYNANSTDWTSVPASGIDSSDIEVAANTDDLYIRVKKTAVTSMASIPVKALDSVIVGTDSSLVVVTTYDELVNAAALTSINDIVIDGNITIPSKGAMTWTLDMSLKKITINPEKILTLVPNSSMAFGTLINNGSIVTQGSILEFNYGYLQGGDILGSGMVSGTGSVSISITSEAALRNALRFEIACIDISMGAPLLIATDLDLAKASNKIPSRRIHFNGNGVLIGAADGITFKVYSGDLLSQHGNTNNFYYSDKTTKIKETFFAPEDHTFTWDSSIQGWVSNVTPRDDSDFTIVNGFLTEYKGAGGEVVIPEGVIRVMNDAFAGNTTITSIYFPKSVQCVGNGEDALRGCTGITSLTFSNTIQFMYCDLNQHLNIKELNIYKGDADSVVRNCFNSLASENSTIEKINIGEDITEIQVFTFRKYKALKQVKLPNSLKVISQDAFSGCENLESVAFPDALEIIGGSSFNGCVKLLEIVIPNGIKEVVAGAFKNCTNLAIVSIPNGLTGLTPDDAFDGCTLLNTLHITLSPSTTILSAIYADVDRILIDEGITEIGPFAFNNLTKVKELKLPGTVQIIEDRAFVGCTNLESITIPCWASTQSETFLNCPNIKNVTVSYKDNPTVSNRLQLPNSVETLDIAEGITEIEAWSFNNLNKLTTILLPNTLTGIDSDCFKNCGQFTMKVYENSYAHQYAIDNNIPFVLRVEE